MPTLAYPADSMDPPTLSFAQSIGLPFRRIEGTVSAATTSKFRHHGTHMHTRTTTHHDAACLFSQVVEWDEISCKYDPFSEWNLWYRVLTYSAFVCFFLREQSTFASCSACLTKVCHA